MMDMAAVFEERMNMTNTRQNEEHTSGSYPLNCTETVNIHARSFDDFIQEYGEECYQKVLLEFGGDAGHARYHIEERLVSRCTRLTDFMEYYLFDWIAGRLLKENHPLLDQFVDFHRLAVARWEAGYVRIVAHKGTFFCFDCSDPYRFDGRSDGLLS